MSIPKLFKFLKHTIHGKRYPMEKLKRDETANVIVNSENFINPAKCVMDEEHRLQNSKTIEASSIYY